VIYSVSKNGRFLRLLSISINPLIPHTLPCYVLAVPIVSTKAGHDLGRSMSRHRASGI
jgi:hypothetical protein